MNFQLMGNSEGIESNYTPPLLTEEGEGDVEFAELHSFTRGTAKANGYGTLVHGYDLPAAFEPTFVLSHAVTEQDTIAGLCLRYMVSVRQLEKHNPDLISCKMTFTCDEVLLPVTRTNVNHLVAWGSAQAACDPEAIADPENTECAEDDTESVGNLYSDKYVTMTETAIVLHHYYFSTHGSRSIPYVEVDHWVGTSLHYLCDRYTVPAGVFPELQTKILSHQAHDKCICLKIKGHLLPVVFMVEDFGAVQQVLASQLDSSPSIPSSNSSVSAPDSPTSDTPDGWTFLDGVPQVDLSADWQGSVMLLQHPPPKDSL